jgi:hypothetical protein
MRRSRADEENRNVGAKRRRWPWQLLPCTAATSLLIVAAFSVRAQSTSPVRVSAIGDPRYEFSTITAVTQSPDGAKTFVAQPLDGKVLVFENDGSRVAALGRRGNAIGQFLGIESMGWLGDTLWVVDPRLRRVSWFDRGVRYLKADQLPLSPDSTLPSVRGYRVLRDGGVVVRVTAEVTTDTSASALISISDGGGARVRTIHPLKIANESFKISTEVYGKPGWISGPQPLADSPLWASSEDGALVVVVERPAATAVRVTNQYRVILYGANGERLLQEHVQYSPKPIPAEYLEVLIAPYLRPTLTAPKSDLTAKRFMEALYRPATMPPVTDVIVSADSIVWIRREAIADTVVYDRVAAAGRRLSSLRFPAGAAVLWAKARLAIIRVVDAEDVPRLFVYQLPR